MSIPLSSNAIEVDSCSSNTGKKSWKPEGVIKLVSNFKLSKQKLAIIHVTFTQTRFKWD